MTDKVNVRIVITFLGLIVLACIAADMVHVGATLPHDVGLVAVGALGAILATTRTTPAEQLVPPPPAPPGDLEGGV